MSKFYAIRAGSVCALVGAVVLVLMAVSGFSAGDALNRLAQPGSLESYLTILRANGAVIIRVMALDNLFLIGYTGAFIGAATLVWQRARFFGSVGLSFGILTAALDLMENAITVNVTRAALAGAPVSIGQGDLLTVIGQVKYGGAGLALAAFAIALMVASPGRRPLTWVVAGLFALFPVVNAYTVVNPGAAAALIVWMLLCLLASSALLWRAAQVYLPPRRPDGRSGRIVNQGSTT